MSERITTRIPPSADMLKNNYTHSFVDRMSGGRDHFIESVKDLLVSSQLTSMNKLGGAKSFRWCLIVKSSSADMNSVTEIYLSKSPKYYVARIGSDYYNLDQKVAEHFFAPFDQLFGFN